MLLHENYAPAVQPKKKKEPGWHKESIAVSDLSQEHLPHKKKHLKAFPLAVTIPLTILRQV